MFELHKDEKVLLYIRRHWIFLFIQTKLIFLLFITPTILVWIAQVWGFVPEVNLFGVSIYALTDILIYLWALFCWMLLAEKFTDYAIDFWVVTNKRIIESEMIKLFDVKLSTLELQDIEDITVQSAGFLANMIGYGTLSVQTAGTNREFYAEQIMKPQEVQKIIFDAKVADEKDKQDIEKGEVEQISKRIFKEKEIENNSKIDEYSDILNFKKNPNTVVKSDSVQDLKKNDEEFDWAFIDERQKMDSRNVTEVLDNVDEYKKDINKALRAE